MQKELVEFCQKNEIAVVAYCPLGRPGEDMGGRPSIMETDVVKSISAKVERSPAQVLLQWGLARGLSVIPKTGNKKRAEENLACDDFVLSEDDMKALNGLDCNYRIVDSVRFGGMLNAPIFY